MADFETAVNLALKHEGGFVDHPSDPGGATNFGISLRFLATQKEICGDFDQDGDVDYNDIKNMEIDDAKRVYKVCWWDKYNFSALSNQRIADKLFDTAINCGMRQCALLCQRAVNRVHQNPELKVDGLFGTKTLEMLNKINPDRFLPVFRSEQAAFYEALVKNNPKLSVFLKGWLKRSYS